MVEWEVERRERNNILGTKQFLPKPRRGVCVWAEKGGRASINEEPYH